MVSKFVIRMALAVGILGVVTASAGAFQGDGRLGSTCPKNACVSCWNATFLCTDNKCKCKCNVTFCDSTS